MVASRNLGYLVVLAVVFLGGCGRNLEKSALVVAADGGSRARLDTSAALDTESVSPDVIVGYFTEWSVYDRGYSVAEVPAEALTHINYAFAGITEDGSVILIDRYAALEKPAADSTFPAGNIPQLRELKRRSPHLRVLLSVGGWSGSAFFSAVAESPVLRARFCGSILELIRTHGFDGVDVDWEFPVICGLSSGRPEDRAGFTALGRDLRALLGPRYLLTAAVNATPGGIEAIDYREASAYFDWFNLMSYDLAGAWDPRTGLTGHHAPLHSASGVSVSSAVAGLLAAGVPPRKIVVGVPLYGRSFAGSKPAPGSGYSGPGVGTREPGVLEFREIVRILSSGSGVSAWWDDAAHAPSIFLTGDSSFVTYEDERSVRAKAEFIHREGLRGVMMWELSQDSGILVRAMHDGMVAASNDR